MLTILIWFGLLLLLHHPAPDKLRVGLQLYTPYTSIQHLGCEKARPAMLRTVTRHDDYSWMTIKGFP